MPPTLTPFEGHEVTKSQIEIRRVGGGLQDALEFDPVEIGQGEVRWVAVQVRCDSIRHDPIKDSDCLARVHIFKPVDKRISFLDDDPHLVGLVEKHVDDSEERTRRAAERAAGILRLGDGGDEGDGEEPFGHRPEEADGSRSGDDAQDDPTARDGDDEDGDDGE